jgi:AraC family transcriptional regulator of adaptative response/methylated-DNA-[protein]-cysteine methyltransferase
MKRNSGNQVTYETVSSAEIKSGEMEIIYGVHESPFGWCLLGITKRGICHLLFLESDNAASALSELKTSWPTAKVAQNPVATKPFIQKIFFPERSSSKLPLHLLVKGTHFQIKVWEALLRIPQGVTATYASVATTVGSPKAVRAAGSACGKNKIAYLIPCHRVLTSSGGLGGYRWGIERKEAMLVRESSQ